MYVFTDIPHVRDNIDVKVILQKRILIFAFLGYKEIRRYSYTRCISFERCNMLVLQKNQK